MFDKLCIEPAKIRGFGKDFSLPQGGLHGKTFLSRCPPVVTSTTRVLAVCGPNDFRDNASPEKDGWFFSDFFLFHHLFKGQSSDQVWLICVKPETLVSKYGQFVHGSSKGDRRIVLDQDLLDETADITAIDTSRSTNSENLVERFVATLRDECSKAIRNEQPVLVLVFAHGRPNTQAVYLGGHREGEKAPTLTSEVFSKAISKGLKVTMIITSCYGGEWTQMPHMNTTAMTAVDETHEFISWPKTMSSGRYCGGRYATAITVALIKMSFPKWELDDDSELESLENDNATSATYAQLAKTIRHTLFEEVDNRESNTISFSAMDDKWAMEWQQRTGLPLSDFESKWQELKKIELTSETTGNSQAGSVRLASDRPLYRYHQAVQVVKRKALLYLASFPGPSEAAKNHNIHSLIDKVLQGKPLSQESLDCLNSELDYRQIHVMAHANSLRDSLGLVYPDCEDIEAEPVASEWINKCVWNYALFSEPIENEGWQYNKGQVYLTMAIKAAGWTREKTEAELAKMQQLVGTL